MAKQETVSLQTRVETLLEEASATSLEKIILPILRGTTPMEKIDRVRLNTALQMVSRHQGMIASKAHEKELALIAIRMVTGGDTDAVKALIVKHYDPALALPPSK